MKEKDLMNIPDNKGGNDDFVIMNEAACSAEFPEGCILLDED